MAALTIILPIMGAGTAYVAVYLAAPGASTWPVDVGDDPAFECSRLHAQAGGRLSWGVCRPDLRNEIRPGDVVVFVAADRLRDRRPARYRLAGWGTAERLVSQVEVWQREDLAVFRKYRNLLIRPSADGNEFVHCETQAPAHPDWLWRLARRSPGAPRKSRWEAAGETRVSAAGMVKVGGRNERLAPNYVLFSAEADGTIVLADPPVVAMASVSGEPETWSDSAFATDLQKLLLGEASSRGLRTRNRQQPHRHLRLSANADAVTERLGALIKEHKIAPRKPLGDIQQQDAPQGPAPRSCSAVCS